MTTRADIIRVLHQAYVDNGWMPPTLDGYADALMAAGYGPTLTDAVLAEIRAAAWERGRIAGASGQRRRPDAPAPVNPFREPSPT